MAEKYSEKMPTRGIRMPDEQWKTCQEMSEELGYRYPSDFIRDAIDFYVEWKKSDSAEKFLTPACLRRGWSLSGLRADWAKAGRVRRGRRRSLRILHLRELAQDPEEGGLLLRGEAGKPPAEDGEPRSSGGSGNVPRRSEI